MEKLTRHVPTTIILIWVFVVRPLTKGRQTVITNQLLSEIFFVEVEVKNFNKYLGKNCVVVRTIVLEIDEPLIIGMSTCVSLC